MRVNRPLERPRTSIAARAHVELASMNSSGCVEDIHLYSHLPVFLKHWGGVSPLGRAEKERRSVKTGRPG
jgi:hypothetical protein